LAVLHVEHSWWSSIISIFAVGHVTNSHPHAHEHQGQHKVFQQNSIQRQLDQQKLETNGEAKDDIGDVFDYHKVTNYYDVSTILSAVSMLESQE